MSLTTLDKNVILSIGGENMLSKKEVAELLNVTERTIDRYRKQGMPCTVLPTGTVRFDLEKVNQWIKGE